MHCSAKTTVFSCSILHYTASTIPCDLDTEWGHSAPLCATLYACQHTGRNKRLSLSTTYNNHVSVTVDDREGEGEARKTNTDWRWRDNREKKRIKTGSEEKIVEERGAWSMQLRIKITWVAAWCLLVKMEEETDCKNRMRMRLLESLGHNLKVIDIVRSVCH